MSVSSPPPGSATTTTGPISLVEDDPDFAHYIQLLLRTQLHAEVTHYKDGLDGLLGILEKTPAMAVLDLDLPTLRGEEICRRLRTSQSTRDLPILVCSSLPEPQRRELELLRLGADAYLEKPFIDEQFLDCARKLFAKGKDRLARLGDHHGPPAPGPADSDTDSYGAAETPASRAAGPRPGLEAIGFHAPAPLAPEPLGLRPTPPLGHQPGDNNEFAGFRIERILGGGGMGTVYKAWQSRSSRFVALKVLLKSLAGIPLAVERFMREGKIMSTLEHPNVVQIFETGRTPFSYFIVMELVPGMPLDQRIESSPPLSWPQQKEISTQLIDAMVYLHSRGVLHRDLKPSNVMLTPEGQVKLTDFGISRAGPTVVGDMKLTRDASLVGTPSFMAPEQLQGAEASESTDVYALARTLFYLFEGRRPAIPPRPLRETRPDLPQALSDAMEKCCHADSRQRVATMAEARDLIIGAFGAT